MFMEYSIGIESFFFWCITFSLGIGTNIQFWVDWWCKDGVLKDALSVLYSIAQAKGKKDHFHLK